MFDVFKTHNYCINVIGPFFIIIFVLMIFFPRSFAKEKIRVVTTITVLEDFVKQVGGEYVEVESISRGNQDPHFIEILPSYMMMVKNADIFVMIGLELELWAQQIIDGSRNAKLKIIDCSKDIEKLEIPTFSIDARYGDIHRFGNPHYWLDPLNTEIIMNSIIDGLVDVSPEYLEYFISRKDTYLQFLNKKTEEWIKKTKPYKGTPVIFYHNQWPYFCKRFGFVAEDFIEPKPGIKSSASHIAKLIKEIKEKKIPLIITNPYYEDRNPKLLERSTGAKLIVLPSSIDPDMKINNYIELFDYIIDTLVKNLSKN